MSLAEAAAAAVAVFPHINVTTTAGVYPLPVVMVAIAGAESGWNNTDAGDCGYPDLPSCGPCTDGGTGATSWGLWQVHSVHIPLLTQLTGSTDPCVWREWLFVPLNCAVAARAVYEGAAGLGNWTTYSQGEYVQYLGTAQAAVRAAQTPTQKPPPPITPSPPPPLANGWIGWVVVGAAIGAGAGLGYVVSRNPRVQRAVTQGAKTGVRWAHAGWQKVQTAGHDVVAWAEEGSA